MTAPSAPGFTVLAIVGTDHHRFDRLVDWLDAWAERQTAPTHVVVQHGSARAPRAGEGEALLPHDRLQALMASASVVVSHGGPGTISEAWRHGRLPVVVPRDPARAEHVDGHQQRFSRRMAEQGLVLLCEEQAELDAALDAARRDPATVAYGDGAHGDRVQAAVRRVGEIVDELVESRSRRRRGLGRLRR